MVCDGARSDGTLDIIKRYSSIVTEVVSEKDKNVADALNRGFSRASGDIRAYINADDCLTEGPRINASPTSENGRKTTDSGSSNSKHGSMRNTAGLPGSLNR